MSGWVNVWQFGSFAMLVGIGLQMNYSNVVQRNTYELVRRIYIKNTGDKNVPPI